MKSTTTAYNCTISSRRIKRIFWDSSSAADPMQIKLENVDKQHTVSSDPSRNDTPGADSIEY